jgi:uncharacterized membrane protein YbhN (UPF0104 family)
METRISSTAVALRAQWPRLAAPAAVVAVAVALALALGDPARTFVHALERSFSADPLWVLAAVAFEALSFAGYVALLWHVAGRETPRLGLRESYQVTLAGAAVTRLLPTAGAGGAALTLWTLQRAGRRGRAGVRTLLTFLVVLYGVFLVAIAVAGGLVAARVVPASGPVALGAVPAALAVVAIVVALAWRPSAARAARVDRAGRARASATVLAEAVRDALGLVRRGDPRLAGAIAWWGFDLAVLWAIFEAVGSPPPVGVLVLGYLLGQVANTVPVPGAASGGLVGVLLALGAPPEATIASVLAYRAIAIWLPAPLGAAALAGLRHTVRRWSTADAEHAVERPVDLAAARRSRAAGAPALPDVLAA